LAERLFAIADLELPEDIYTRARGSPWWAHVHAYAEEMKAGAKFPPILVGELDGRLIVVDGYHRVGAYKELKIEYIQGVYKKYTSLVDLLKDAIDANNHHGIRYTPQDKAYIAKLLQEYGLQKQEVADLVRVPVDKLNGFTIRNLDNKTLKAPLARLVREGKLTEEEAAEVDQSRFSTMMLDDVLVQLISYLEFGAYPWGDAKYDAYAKKIMGLITPHIQG
jgi:hypothetical protein